MKKTESKNSRDIVPLSDMSCNETLAGRPKVESLGNIRQQQMYSPCFIQVGPELSHTYKFSFSSKQIKY
jgi:hypothetical protein